MQPSENDRKRWGAAVAAGRAANDGMSQYELAKRVDLHPQTISDLERGIARTSEAARTRIAVALGLDPQVLLSTEAEGIAS